jgi:hypothetical protein
MTEIDVFQEKAPVLLAEKAPVAIEAVRAENLELEGIPDVTALTRKQAKKKLWELCYKLLYAYQDKKNGLGMSPVEAHDYLWDNFEPLIRQAGYEALIPITIERVAQKHVDGLWRSRMSIAAAIVKKDFMITEMLLKEVLRDVFAGDTSKANEVIAILKRRAAMTGYDAPKKIDIAQGAGDMMISDEDKRRALRAAKDAEAFEQKLLEGG